MEENGSITALGKEVRVQLPANQRETLLNQVKEIVATDTGCWFELEKAGQLRLRDQKTGREVEFVKSGETWKFERVNYPIKM